MIVDFTEVKGHLLVPCALVHNGAVVGGRARFPAAWLGLWVTLLGRGLYVLLPRRGLRRGTPQGQGLSWMKQHNARRQEARARVLFPPQPRTREAPRQTASELSLSQPPPAASLSQLRGNLGISA